MASATLMGSQTLEKKQEIPSVSSCLDVLLSFHLAGGRRWAIVPDLVSNIEHAIEWELICDGFYPQV